MSVRVRLIGQPEILDGDGEPRVVRGFQTWALLARLVAADRPLTRRELSAELFPETADPLGSLRWCLAGLRHAVGSADAFCGDPIQLDLPSSVTVDLVDLLDGTFDPCLAGEFLEGVDPRCGPEFDTWLLVQRERVAALQDARIRDEVMTSLSAGDRSRALELAELGARRSPLDEGAQILLVTCLRDSGHHAATVALVDEVETRFRDELGIEPSPTLRSAARPRLADPPPGVSPRAIAASQLDAGLAAISAGATDAGLDSLRSACQQAERSDDVQLRSRCLFELGSALVHTVRSHDDEGAVLLRRAADLAEGVGDAATAAAAFRELGYVDALAGRRPAAAAHLDHARVLAGDNDDLMAGIVSVSGWNRFDWGHEDEGVAEYEEAVELARRSGNDRRLVWTLGLGGWALVERGDQRARAWLTECAEVVGNLRWIAFQPWPQTVLAELDLRTGGRPDEILPSIEETFALSCQLTDPCWEGGAARTLAMVTSAAGRADEALEWITTARQRCLRETDVFVTMHAAILATDIELSREAGLDERVESTARTLVALAARTHQDAYLDRGLAALGASGRR